MRSEQGSTSDGARSRGSDVPAAQRDQGAPRDRGLRWPIGIAITGAIVVAVNMAFIWIAVSVQDDVVPSYAAEAR
jgi:hypothetical protein